jgi:uroporphyrinogen-III synthase
MADCPLRVLVPRPLRDNDQFLQLLNGREIGGRKVSCLLWPVMAIESLIRSREQREVLARQLDRAEICIFVSAAAAKIVLEVADINALGRPQLFAVGKATAERLQAHGIAVAYPDGASTEALLALPQLREVRDRQIVICRGEGGREALAQGLSARGGVVEYAELYRRVVEPMHRNQIQAALAQHQVDAVMIHSAQVFQCLLELLDDSGRRAFASLPVVVPGQRVADIVSAEGVENVIVAPDALPENMVAGLVHWYTQK